MLTKPRPIRLKGRSFLALALSPELPFEDWLARLDDLAARSAGFFLRRPGRARRRRSRHRQAELRDLVDKLGTRNVRVMGIEGARPSLLGPDMPPAMTDGRPASDFEEPVADAPKSAGNGRPPRPGQPPMRAPPAGDVADAGQGDAVDDRHRAGAFRPVGDLPGRRRHHHRLGRIGRGSRRRRLDPRLRHAAGAGAGRLDRQRLGAHLLPQAGSGAARDRRPLQDGRGHGAGPARTGRPGLARRRCDRWRRHSTEPASRQNRRGRWAK